jgi:cellulose synthase/poly-beta-1,6-N-acetylglucosamine synthase-like glycosyltransferase
MEVFVSWPLLIVAALLATPVMVFLIEIVAAIVLPEWPRVVRSPHDGRGRVAVLVPAHNESVGILPTLGDIQSQLLPGDRLLVVADNCSDDTAAVALQAGAEVVERYNLAQPGKGYALECGIQYLSPDPVEVVVVVDADCRLEDEAIDRLARSCGTTGRPAQALYLMSPPDGSGINYQVAEFAWRVKNWLRPLGLDALRLPCQLMGTGMAFPWDVIRSADLASGSIVEDLKLGLDLALAGHPPLFCPSARVRSRFASSIKAAKTQRERWEHGHINIILKATPRLLHKALASRDGGVLALALDIAVPPLSLLGMLVIGAFAITVLAAMFGLSSVAMILNTANLLAFLLAGLLAWLKCGRDVLPPRAILSIIPYILGKISIYHHILSGRAAMHWIRTDRTRSE